MKYIAFKRIKNHTHKELFQDTLPLDYIIEFSDFNKYEHTVDKGYEILNENDFNKEINKNKDLVEQLTKQKLDIEQAHKKTMEQQEELKKASEKKDFQLYLQFLKWKEEMEAESLKLKQLEIERLQRVQQGIGTKDDLHPITWGNPLKQREQQRKDQMKTKGII